MTPEAQRIALAEWDGWKPPTDCARQPNHKWQSPIDGCCYNELPDSNDLNVVHRWEKRLDDVQFAKFRTELLDVIIGVVANPRWLKSPLPSSTLAISAEASERCEALLKTLGLWKE